MNCKKCGKEIIGEIQRYCNDCKRELSGEIGEAENTLEKAEVIQPKEKRHRIFSLGYILLVLVMIIVIFLVSCVVGFSIGPVLPI